MTKDIGLNSFGEVKLDGQIWLAKADIRIAVGALVEIVDIQGCHVVVKVILI